jgi:hypothetical protein
VTQRHIPENRNPGCNFFQGLTDGGQIRDFKGMQEMGRKCMLVRKWVKGRKRRGEE